MLSSLEVKALDAILEVAIVKSKEEDDGDPVFHVVDTREVSPVADEKTLDLVYTGLAKQGLIECSGSEDATGNESEYVCITHKGLESLKAAKGVH